MPLAAITTYAVIWSENDGPECVGKLALTETGVALSGTASGPCDAQRELDTDELVDVYLDRSAPGRRRWEPALVLVTRAGDRVAVGSLEGLGALHELADRVAGARGKAAARVSSGTDAPTPVTADAWVIPTWRRP
jgi:hypothetical protein